MAIVPSPFGITPLEELEIQRNAPEVDAELTVIRSIFCGYKVEILLKLHNVSDVVLDRLCASLEISDLKLTEKKERSYDLPNLLPNEKREFAITERIGRSLNHTVDLQISRKGIKLAEAHWTLKPKKSEMEAFS